MTKAIATTIDMALAERVIAAGTVSSRMLVTAESVNHVVAPNSRVAAA